MPTAHISLYEIIAIVRRRKWIIIVPTLLVTTLCVVGAFMLPRKFESSTTIWVQRDEILNPLVSFTMAVQMASEDRLRTFNEIVLARKTVDMLIDSLDLDAVVTTGVQRDELVDKVKSNIRTERRGSDSFSITYTDTDPVRAQRAVTILADHFIQTRLQAETQRNDLTVDFFEQKLGEYQEKFGETQEKFVSLLRQRVQELPSSSSLSNRLDAIDEKTRNLSDQIKTYQRAQINVAMFPDAFRTEHGRQALSELQRADLPFGYELRTLIGQYDSVTVRYTTKYPEVGKYEAQIVELLKRVRLALGSEIATETAKLDDLQKSRAKIIEEIMHSSVAARTDQDKESNYSFYRQLYNDMKVKLEQARIAQELGKKAENQFIILDPPRIPAKPTKPNRRLIIIGGFVVGLLMGVVAAGAAELLDTRIRSSYQVEVFQKPVIALLPDGSIRSARRA